MVKKISALKSVESVNTESAQSSDKADIISMAGKSDKEGDEPVPCDKTSLDYIATEEEVFEALEKAFREQKYLKFNLLFITESVLFNLTGANEIDGLNAQDIISIAYEKILNGKRKWKKNKHPNIVNFIIMVIYSLIRNKRKKYLFSYNPLYDVRETGEPEPKLPELKRLVTVPYENYHDNRRINEDEGDVNIKFNNYDIESRKNFDDEIDNDKKDFYELIAELEAELENDEEAYYVLQERLKGDDSNISIAKELGLEVREVENALKRIRRAAAKIKKNNSK